MTKENILAYALRNYENPQTNSLDEFMKDFRIPKYLKRQFNKYEETGELGERLILNHLITYFNVFTTECAQRMLFFYTDKSQWSFLRTFLVYLNRCPKIIDGHLVNDIPLDSKIVDVLRKI